MEHSNDDAEGDNEQSNDFDVAQVDETASLSYADTTIRLEFPKFSKGFQRSDFNKFVQNYVGEENLEKLEKLENCEYDNLWIMRVKTKEIRENLLRVWKTKIKNKTCWISPYYDYELRGFLHWLPHFITDDDVKRQLSQFGNILILENEVHDYWNGKVTSEVKYFGLRLKDGMVKEDLPHFLKFGGYRTLVIVRGRKPACFHCREFGHSKKDCKKYEEKLNEYCKNPEARRPRAKPRGRRHRPDSDVKYDSEDNKHQNKTNNTSSISVQQDSKLIRSGPTYTYSHRKSTEDEKKVEILAILRSLKVWKDETTEMVEQVLKNMEENFRRNLTLTEMIESEVKEESINFPIEIITEQFVEIKQTTIQMIEQTLNNLKNVLTEYFGMDSNEPLEKLISDFETNRKEQPGPKEEKLVEEQLSYKH